MIKSFDFRNKSPILFIVGQVQVIKIPDIAIFLEKFQHFQANKANKDGKTALMLASENGYSKIVELLQEN